MQEFTDCVCSSSGFCLFWMKCYIYALLNRTLSQHFIGLSLFQNISHVWFTCVVPYPRAMCFCCVIFVDCAGLGTFCCVTAELYAGSTLQDYCKDDVSAQKAVPVPLVQSKCRRRYWPFFLLLVIIVTSKGHFQGCAEPDCQWMSVKAQRAQTRLLQSPGK